MMISLGIVGDKSQSDNINSRAKVDPEGVVEEQVEGVLSAGIVPTKLLLIQWMGYEDVRGFPVNCIEGMHPTIQEYVQGKLPRLASRLNSEIHPYGNICYAHDSRGALSRTSKALRVPAPEGFVLNSFVHNVWLPWSAIGARRYWGDELGTHSLEATRLTNAGVPIGLEAPPGIDKPTGWEFNFYLMSKYPTMATLGWWRERLEKWPAKQTNIPKSYETYCLVQNQHLPIKGYELETLRRRNVRLACECLKDVETMKRIWKLMKGVE